MNNQEAFDKMVRHLHKQEWKQSVDSDGFCAYRGEYGAMCAVGALITDEEYEPSMDDENLTAVMLVRRFGLLSGVDKQLLIEMQDFHDGEMKDSSQGECLEYLEDMAKSHGLSNAVLEEIY